MYERVGYLFIRFSGNFMNMSYFVSCNMSNQPKLVWLPASLSTVLLLLEPFVATLEPGFS